MQPPWSPGVVTPACVLLAKSGIVWPLVIVAVIHTAYCAAYTVKVYRGR